MKSKRVCKKILSIFFALLLILSTISGRVILPAFADGTKLTGALEDLQKDSEFDASIYPPKADDYSVKLIQVAEGTGGRLFVYTYQPCQRTRYLIATSINMALTKDLEEDKPVDLDSWAYGDGMISGGEDFGSGGPIIGGGNGGGGGGSSGGGGGGGGTRPASTVSEINTENEFKPKTELYGLTLVNVTGVFGKYLVKDFTVSSEKIRYYNITSIYRKWDPRIDGAQTGGQEVSEKAYPVGTLWTVGTFNGSLVYDASELEVVKVTDEMVGFRRYSEGFQWDGTYSCDAHFLAFSCDHKIDKLISADISFYTQKYKTLAGSGTTYERKVACSRTLYDYEKGGTDSDGWFDGGDYVWDRMTSTAEYCEDMRKQGSTITDEEIKTLTKYDWILNFYETEYKCEAGGKDVLISCLLPLGFIWTIVNGCTTTGALVSDVTLLRLEFETDNKVYNLGVVSDKQTGSEDPIGGEKPSIITGWEDFWNKIKEFFKGHSDWWVYVLAAIIVLLLLPTILGFIFPVVGQFLLNVLKHILSGLWWLIKGLWWLICLPFKGIAALIKHRKERK